MLANPPIMNGDHGPMLDKGNIINIRDGESLYQICLKLRRRLSEVPGFRRWIEVMEEQEAEGADPVSSLWQCFRSGLPLLAIYNASQPEEGDLAVDSNKAESRVGKEAAFMFLRACKEQMKISSSDIFTLTDLYNDNTTGFVKVTKLVNRVLDILALSGKLHSSGESDDSRDGTEIVPGPKKPMTRREYILRELVETERQYVHHLLNLQALKKELEEIGALTGDAIHDIFLNLNNLLDFAQRFLIRVEQQNELMEEQQNWGQLFVHYKEPFKQYEPFIANQRRCEVTCNKEWDKMVATIRSPLAKQMLANPTILNGFLLKPFQRLTKYPLLLKELQNQIQSDDLKADIAEAILIIQGVLQQADASIDKETKEDALGELKERVEDWKSLKVHEFGDLLLMGTFSVLKDSALREQEKEYHIYLFHKILIMCKEQNLNKQSKKFVGQKEKQTLSLRGKPKMHLKGRIYFTNVTNVISSSGPGNYLIQIIWKGDPATESFMIKFKNDETMRKWNEAIETQRTTCLREQKQNGGGTSTTHFVGFDTTQMQNPYQQEHDNDDDYGRSSEGSSTVRGNDGMGYSEFNMSRNASSTSLRSRSATNSSGSTLAHNSIGRSQRYGDHSALPPLNTKLSREAQSPGDYAAMSYFSPIDRDITPPSSSTRTSSQSTQASYYRAGHLSGPPRAEESYRNTAPAMARNITSSNGNPYMANGRLSNSRPALPPGSVQSANQGPTSRHRSASSPDPNPNFQQSRKYISGENVPNVPPIPAHVAKQMAPPSRSSSSAPNSALPMRNAISPYPGQSHGPPGARPPLTNHTYTYDPSYAGHIDHRTVGQGMLPIASLERTLSPPLTNGAHHDNEPTMPSQLKAKVQFDDNYVSMIIPSNIQFRSLTDRIDAKLSRFTNHSIAAGSVRLRYQDEDGDFIWIDSDEAVQDALLDWREQHGDTVTSGQFSEILLYAHSNQGVTGQ